MVKKDIKKKSKKTKKERRVEKELLWIVGFLVFLVIIFLVASSVFKSLNQIEYEGLIFTKKLFGEIPVYHYSYVFKAPTGQVIQYNLYLRNDPTTNDVPIEGDINLVGTNVYITLDTSYLDECAYSPAAIGGLTQFLKDNQFTVKSGNMDFVEAAIRGQEYVTCENKEYQNVVQIFKGNETEVSIKLRGQCISISVGPDCRILEAVEKFEIHAFLDAQENN